MSHACTPIYVGVAFLVSEILLLSKMAKFPFLSMDYSQYIVSGCACIPTVKKHALISEGVLIFQCFVQ